MTHENREEQRDAVMIRLLVGIILISIFIGSLIGAAVTYKLTQWITTTQF